LLSIFWGGAVHTHHQPTVNIKEENMALTVSGKLIEIIFARFEPGEDLRRGLLAVIKEKDIKSGVVLSITGALERATVQRFQQVGEPSIPVELVEVPGPLEVSGHGIIGQVEAPAFGDTVFGVGDDFIHGEPYLHVHLTATSTKETVCGHLMDGSPVRSIHTVSHFTVVLGRIEGAMVKMLGEPGPEPGSYRLTHELVQL
jgi:predicted DNA-binding protein with PD1-like motif